jgi:arabinosyltransferase C
VRSMTHVVGPTPPAATAGGELADRKPASVLRARSWGAPKIAGLFGAFGAVFAVLFALAPVDQRMAAYSWDLDGGISATPIPLSSYRPIAMSVTFGCAQVNALPGSGGVFSTKPAPATTAGSSSTGLWIGRTGDRTEVVLAGRMLLSRPSSELPCEIGVTTTAETTTVTAGSEMLAEWAGDHRPAVAGFFTDLPPNAPVAGLSARLQADTRFETSPSALKIVAGAAGVLCMAGSLAAAWVADRRAEACRRIRLWPGRGAARGRAPDAMVVGGLTVWALIGPLNVDDGYTTTMVRNAASAGYVGGYHHWLNTPEAPFGWFYEGFRLWSQISSELLWLRVPSVVAAVACWLLLSRLVLPRVLPASRATRWAGWLAAVAFLSAWLPFCVGLRPEPYVVLGMLATWCCIERAVGTRRLLPLAIGVITAGLTLAVTPTGMIAPLVIVVAAPAIWRILRARQDLHGFATVGVLLGCALLPLLVMLADQTPAALQAGTAVRTLIGPNLPWYDEPLRYQMLLAPTSVEGSLGRRVPVLLMLLGISACVAVWRRRWRVPGVHAGAAARFVMLTGLGLAMLTLTPTKWTHHFGGFAGCATIMIVALAWVGTRTVRSTAYRSLLLGAVFLAAFLALSGEITWWSASAEAISWGDRPPELGGVPLWKAALVGAGVCAAVWAVQSWHPSLARWLRPLLPSTATALLVLLTGTLALQTYGLAHAVTTSTGYTVGRDVLGNAMGRDCTLAHALQIEPSPAADILPAAAGPAGISRMTGSLQAGAPSTAHASPYPVPPSQQWQSNDGAGGQLVTGWYPLPTAIRHGSAPLVITAGGSGDATAVAEFGTRTNTAPQADASFRVTAAVPLPLSDTPADIRPSVPRSPAAPDAVRVSARLSEGPPSSWISVTAPRTPQLVALNTVYPAQVPAVLDWPIAPLMPCQRLATLAGGVAEVPAFVMTDGRPQAEALRGSAGGPFAAINDLADLQPVPTFVAGNPTTWAPRIFRVTPREPLRPPRLDVSWSRVAAWQPDPPLI